MIYLITEVKNLSLKIFYLIYINIYIIIDSIRIYCPPPRPIPSLPLIYHTLPQIFCSMSIIKILAPDNLPILLRKLFIEIWKSILLGHWSLLAKPPDKKYAQFALRDRFTFFRNPTKYVGITDTPPVVRDPLLFKIISNS